MPKPKRAPAAVKKALSNAGVTIPQVAELVGHFMHLAGGPRALAKMMMQEFLSAKAGSQTRQRLMDGVLRMLSMANQQYASVEETDLIGTKDLEAELQSMLRELPDGEEEAQPGEPDGVDQLQPAPGPEPDGERPGPVGAAGGTGAAADDPDRPDGAGP
jgi:hypothetical protein